MKKLKNLNVFLMTFVFVVSSDALYARDLDRAGRGDDHGGVQPVMVPNEDVLPDGDNANDDDFGAFLQERGLVLDIPSYNDDENGDEKIDENNIDY